MADDDWTILEKWEKSTVLTEEKRVPICFGLSATMYFHDAHTLEKRKATLECFIEYEKLTGDSLRWGFIGGVNARMKRYDKSRSSELLRYMLADIWDSKDSDKDDGWAFHWHGGEHQEDASPFTLHAFGNPKFFAELDNSLSYLQVSFPLLWFQGKEQSFPSLILRWCERLKPYHGYGGVTLIQSPNSSLTQRYSPRIAGFASRYPGLEIDSPMGHMLETQEGIKGGNWLTIISNHFVDKLGGQDNLREALGEPFVVQDYDGGVMITAGHIPEVGDWNRNIDTPLYRKLAGVLKPIRIQKHARPYAKGRFAEDGEYEAWLARFDE